MNWDIMVGKVRLKFGYVRFKGRFVLWKADFSENKF